MNPADQARRGARFRALHEARSAFLIPNPWDAGSARFLEHLGFEALATTSAGYAFSAGLPDNGPPWDDCLANAAAIARAVAVPVSGDLGNNFGASADAAATAIRRAAAAGLVGGSIEDTTGQTDAPQFDLSQAVDRVRAAVEAARSLSFPFLVTARAENFLCGDRHLGRTIARLQAYEAAGADVLFAPGLSRLADVAELMRSVGRPVNILAGMAGADFGRSELQDLRVARISVGSALSRAAFTALKDAALEMQERGTFAFAARPPMYGELNAFFSRPPGT